MLSQSEADTLIKVKKKKSSLQDYDFPMTSENITMPVISEDETESFLIDVNRRGVIKLTKCSYQERYHGIIILVRLDIDGPPHTNPDVDQIPLEYLARYNGSDIPCPHLHLFVENYMDKWAIPAPIDDFKNTSDLYSTLGDFFEYCNVVEPPIIQKVLFS